jgi:hypothetical protein
MTTVQLAIRNREYSQALRNLLLRDGTHNVLLVNAPDLQVGGVVVMDLGGCGDLSLFEACPERFVLITRNGMDNLSRVWEAGVRHVVFEEDPPSTAHLSVIAAELRLAQPAAVSAPALSSLERKCRTSAPSALRVLQPAEPRCCHFRRGHLGPER